MAKYRPYTITIAIDEKGTRGEWDRYTSRSSARRALKEDAECLGREEARIEFSGRYSTFESHDREVAKVATIELFDQSIETERKWISDRPYLKGRSLITARSFVSALRARREFLRAESGRV